MDSITETILAEEIDLPMLERQDTIIPDDSAALLLQQPTVAPDSLTLDPMEVDSQPVHQDSGISYAGVFSFACWTIYHAHSRKASPQDCFDRNRNVRLRRPASERLKSFPIPRSYGAVDAGRIYRAGYPDGDNYDFLVKLKVKTILYVPALFSSIMS